MFTGIVTHIGRVSRIDIKNDLHRFTVQTTMEMDAIKLGASIAHAGVCLTVVEVQPDPQGGCIVSTEAIKETIDKTNLGRLQIGHRINLERSLRYGDDVDGHLVSGHVDGVAKIVSITPFGGGHTIRLEAPEPLRKFIAVKGSVALDGVSLTVAQVHDNDDFDVCIIPHTWDVTTLGTAAPGDLINLEIDPLARYVERILGHIPAGPNKR